MTQIPDQQSTFAKDPQSTQSSINTPPDNTLRGCLTLTALIIACGVVTIACLLLFTEPVP